MEKSQVAPEPSCVPPCHCVQFVTDPTEPGVLVWGCGLRVERCWKKVGGRGWRSGGRRISWRCQSERFLVLLWAKSLMRGSEHPAIRRSPGEGNKEGGVCYGHVRYSGLLGQTQVKASNHVTLWTGAGYPARSTGVSQQNRLLNIHSTLFKVSNRDKGSQRPFREKYFVLNTVDETQEPFSVK